MGGGPSDWISMNVEFYVVEILFVLGMSEYR